MEGPLGQALIEYWTARLSALTDLALPDDSSPDRIVSPRAAIAEFTVPAADVDRLTAMSRRSRVPFATVMLAVLTLFLHKVSGQDDITVGVPLSDRRHPDFEQLIGLFMNVVVVRTALTSELTFLDLLDRVRRALLDACRYQDLPYGHLVQIIPARKPFYRVVFNFMPPVPASAMELPGLQVVPLAIAAESQALADLSLHVRQASGTLICRFVYKADLFSSARIRHFVEQFRILVSAIADGPEKGIDAYESRDAADGEVFVVEKSCD